MGLLVSTPLRKCTSEFYLIFMGTISKKFLGHYFYVYRRINAWFLCFNDSVEWRVIILLGMDVFWFDVIFISNPRCIFLSSNELVIQVVSFPHGAASQTQTKQVCLRDSAWFDSNFSWQSSTPWSSSGCKF